MMQNSPYPMVFMDLVFINNRISWNHVIIGTIFLCVVLIRVILGHFHKIIIKF